MVEEIPQSIADDIDREIFEQVLSLVESPLTDIAVVIGILNYLDSIGYDNQGLTDWSKVGEQVLNDGR